MGAYAILEQTLNLRTVTVYDRVTDAEGTTRSVLNARETMLAQQKQAAIKDAFAGWIWKDPQRRQHLEQVYNERFNNLRPAEFSGEHIRFHGMNPAIQLRTHQKEPLPIFCMAEIRFWPMRLEPEKRIRWLQLQWKVSGWGYVRKAYLSFPIT